MTQMIPKDKWVPRSARKLREQLPEDIPEAEDITPEEAVEIYLLEEPPGDATAPEG